MEENPELQHELKEEAATPVPMKISLIVAMGKNREIGRNNDLMWHLGEDMRFFKRTTLRHYIIMGRKNFESIPAKYRPLPERINIIISRNADYMYEECYTCTSLDEALELARDNGEEKVFIIGGGQIYKMAMDAQVVNEMYITHVNASFDNADVFFPEFDENNWSKELLLSVPADSENEYAFETYRYEKK
jgi:dihydrofolate reductase